VTNTRFTSDVIAYATCVKLNLLSWDHPKNNGLKHRIDKSGLHPLTCLTTLTMKEKQQLLDRRIVLCRSLCSNPKLLENIGVEQVRVPVILEEAVSICMGNHKNQ
jgi:hypothetical protein